MLQAWNAVSGLGDIKSYEDVIYIDAYATSNPKYELLYPTGIE